MELRQLRYLIAIAEAGHVGRATQHVHISQPALSQQLGKLERELGVSLFTRHHRGVKPTAAGQLMLEHAQRILDDVEEARQALAEFNGQAETASHKAVSSTHTQTH